MDVLAERWWALGNLHFFRGTSKTWHFCVMDDGDGSVRTVTVSGTHIAWGRKQFEFGASERHGAWLAERQAAGDARK